MRRLPRALVLISGASLLLGGDCMFGRPIVDERARYYPSDGVISCTGTRCEDLPAYELELPTLLEGSACQEDLPRAALEEAVQDSSSLMGMRYVVAAERPREVNLGAIELRDACIVLSGPVRLALGAGSKLSNVTVLLGPARPSERDAEAGPGDAGLDAPDGETEPIAGSSPSYFGATRAAPSLYVGYSELERVVLRAFDARLPSGSAQIEFSTCLQCESRIDSLTVTETNMQNSRLTAGTLNIVGGAFDAVELAFDYGLLAGLVGNDLRTTACRSLSLLGGTIAGRASQIGPCDCTLQPLDLGADDADAGERDASEAEIDASAAEIDASEPPDAGEADAGEPDAGEADAGEPDAGEADASEADASEPDAGRVDAGAPRAACTGASIFQTRFLGGMVDGKVHAENSTFSSVLFARHAPTSLDLWNVEIQLSVVCGQSIDIRLDKTSDIACTSCDDVKSSTACRLDRPPSLTANPCKSFKGNLSACEPPLPTRQNPFVPMTPELGQ